MTTPNSYTANQAVLNDYAQTLLSELTANKDKMVKVLEICTGLTSSDEMEVIHHPLGADGVIADFNYPDDNFDGVMIKGCLYQLESPLDFFNEVLRILKPGGRLSMIEPAISLASWAFYNYGHNGVVHMDIDPFAPEVDLEHYNKRRPNIAYPTVLFTRQEHRIQFMEHFPKFKMVKRKWVGMLADPLSLGDKPFSLIPARLVPLVLEIEEILNPFLGRWLSNKMLITLEKSL